MNINQSTRMFYDADEHKARHINSETPLKFTTSKPTRYFTHESGMVDTRPKLTRRNELDYPSTSLFGTAPYKLRGTPHSQKESELIHGEYVTKTKYKTTEHNFFDQNVLHPNNTFNNVTMNTNGISTRNVYRNVQF